MWTEIKNFLEESDKLQLIEPIRNKIISSDIDLNHQRQFYQEYYKKGIQNYKIIINFICKKMDKSIIEVNIQDLYKIQNIINKFLSDEKRQQLIQMYGEYFKNNDPHINLNIICKKESTKLQFLYNTYERGYFKSRIGQQTSLVDLQYYSIMSNKKYRDLFLSEYINYWIYYSIMSNRISVFKWFLDEYSDKKIFPNMKSRITILDRMSIYKNQIAFFECLLDHGFTFLKKGQQRGIEIEQKVQQELRENKNTKYLYYSSCAQKKYKKRGYQNVQQWWEDYNNDRK